MTYFFDASFLTALFVNDDLFHNQAVDHIQIIDNNNPQYFTSNIVLSETINLIFRKRGRSFTKKFLSHFPKSNIQLFNINQEIFKSGCNILLGLKSKGGLNFFDCLHLATMKELGIEDILTFDSDFKNYAKINEIGLKN